MSEVLGEMIQNTQNYCQHLEQNVVTKTSLALALTTSEICESRNI